MRLRVDAARLPASAIDELKELLERFPGTVEVVLEMDTSMGLRRLLLGDTYRVKPTAVCRPSWPQVFAPGLTAAAAAS